MPTEEKDLLSQAELEQEPKPSQEVAVASSEPGAVAVPTQSAEMLTSLLAAMENPNIDADKVKVLADVATGLQDRELQAQFNRDKVAAIIEMPAITKRGEIIIPGKNGNPDRSQGRYTKYEDLQRVVDPILAKFNMVITHNIGHNEHAVTVQPILSHTNGEVEKGEFMSLPLDTSGSKNNTQGAGSASQYGKRYTTCAMLNIRQDGVDDDGRATASAGGYSSLQPEKKKVVDAGRQAALEGSEKYEAWFKALDVPVRGWLNYNEAENGQTWHQQNKVAAAAVDKG